MKTLHESFTFQSNADYQKVVSICDKSVRVIIHSDHFYPGQSYAYTEVWNDKWHKIHNVLPADYLNLWSVCTNPKCKTHIIQLADELIKLSIEIAGIK